MLQIIIDLHPSVKGDRPYIKGRIRALLGDWCLIDFINEANYFGTKKNLFRRSTGLRLDENFVLTASIAKLATLCEYFSSGLSDEDLEILARLVDKDLGIDLATATYCPKAGELWEHCEDGSECAILGIANLKPPLSPLVLKGDEEFVIDQKNGNLFTLIEWIEPGVFTLTSTDDLVLPQNLYVVYSSFSKKYTQKLEDFLEIKSTGAMQFKFLSKSKVLETS